LALRIRPDASKGKKRKNACLKTLEILDTLDLVKRNKERSSHCPISTSNLLVNMHVL
jgi:hypothetical protein